MSTGGNGMLARNEMWDGWDVRNVSYCWYKTAEIGRSALTPCFPLLRPVKCHKSCFCNPIYLPILLPSIFCYFKEGALRLANPHMPFLFLWLFPFDFLSKASLITSKAPD